MLVKQCISPNRIAVRCKRNMSAFCMHKSCGMLLKVANEGFDFVFSGHQTDGIVEFAEAVNLMPESNFLSV